MRLLLDEMYPAQIAEQLRRMGHEVVSVHEPGHRHLEGATVGRLVRALDAVLARPEGSLTPRFLRPAPGEAEHGG